jgi:hypothetical protein
VASVAPLVHEWSWHFLRTLSCGGKSVDDSSTVTKKLLDLTA